MVDSESKSTADTARRPIGEYYARLYIDRGKPTSDSKVLRERVIAFLERYLWPLRETIADEMHIRLGLRIRVVGITEAHFQFSNFFRDSDIVDLLHTITLIWRLLDEMRNKQLAQQWHDFIKTAIQEENVGYEVDERCGLLRCWPDSIAPRNFVPIVQKRPRTWSFANSVD